MTILLNRVLEPEDVARVREGLAAARWRPGKTTAGPAARPVKENLQADGSSSQVQALEDFVKAALERHPLFAIAARPQRISRLLFSRYEPGMTYGRHTDDALMGADEARLRTDLAFTIFLSKRETYEGGELTIETPLGDQAIALEPGDAILYPAGTIHQVAPVTRGERWAAVGWVQSLIAESDQRAILFNLSLARARFAEAGATRDDLLMLDQAVSNLLRLWAKT